MAQLVFYRRGQELMRVSLDGSRTTIGRGSEADVVVPEATVARLQAAIEWDGERHLLVDLSGKKTRVRGVEVERQSLDDGADLAFGSFRAIYRVHSEAVETSSTIRSETLLSATDVAAEGLPRELWLFARQPGSDRAPVQVALGQGLDVGSAEGSGLLLSHPTISARHARISRQGGRLILQDVGSTNGTSLQGIRVYEVELPLGARARVGPWELWVAASRPPPSPDGAVEFEGIVTADPTLRALFPQIERVAVTSAPVAVFGETGTGKELVARAIHRRSPRAGASFVPLNCSAIARELMESELFGHEKGAFTGALLARRGALEEADGGTLFLDEIGEMPFELQAKLLRAIELGEMKRVGAARPSQVDVRFVCATHRILPEEIRQRRFREDLYYRLAVATLYLPPLRQRKGDVLILWEHFVAKLAPPGQTLSLTDAARQKLLGHAWPGNVRELRNVAQRALLSASSTTLGPADIHFDGAGPGPQAGESSIDPRSMTLEQVERAAIASVMRHLGGNRRAAAKQLDIAKSTLLKKLSDYGLEGEGLEGGAPPEE
ncbi:MAG: sigma 54-interacting transcriptional regulator [Deltaproteobacteria bacterium]